VEGSIGNIIWSDDGKSLYISSYQGASVSGAGKGTVWRANADGSTMEKFVDGCGLVTDAAPGGKYLLASRSIGEEVGIYEIGVADRKCIPLLLGPETLEVRFARDSKSFLYPLASRGQVTFYRQAWHDGKVVGKPESALKLPFMFPVDYKGNAYDFSRDLSTVVYAHPGGQADLYLLGPAR
jgi:hypothetical protein